MFPSPTTTTATFILETALPTSSPASVLDMLHNHVGMMELGSFFVSSRVVAASGDGDGDGDGVAAADTGAAATTTTSTTYEITERIPLLPGGVGRVRVVFRAEFVDLVDGLRTVVHAALGVQSTARWLVVTAAAGGSGEEEEEEKGVVRLREEVEIRCSGLLMPFVKGTMQKSHKALHHRLIELYEKQQRQPEEQ